MHCCVFAGVTSFTVCIVCVFVDAVFVTYKDIYLLLRGLCDVDSAVCACLPCM